MPVRKVEEVVGQICEVGGIPRGVKLPILQSILEAHALSVRMDERKLVRAWLKAQDFGCGAPAHVAVSGILHAPCLQVEEPEEVAAYQAGIEEQLFAGDIANSVGNPIIVERLMRRVVAMRREIIARHAKGPA